MTQFTSDKLIRATNELHRMFMHATNEVIQNDLLLAKFNIPVAIWPALRASWQDSKNRRTLSGRFDFGIKNENLKVYEYNADSASCLFECGVVQDAWVRFLIS
jgi:glutathionylspermidine amidase/synthetase